MKFAYLQRGRRLDACAERAYMACKACKGGGWRQRVSSLSTRRRGPMGECAHSAMVTPLVHTSASSKMLSNHSDRRKVSS